VFRVFLRISVQIIARILHNLWKRAVTDQHIHLPLRTLNRYEVTCHTGTPHRLSIIPTQNSFKISLPAQNALFPPINKLTSACETGSCNSPRQDRGFRVSARESPFRASLNRVSSSPTPRPRNDRNPSLYPSCLEKKRTIHFRLHLFHWQRAVLIFTSLRPSDRGRPFLDF
jgi:hypothetical protein